jgi:hypothetical protein
VNQPSGPGRPRRQSELGPRPAGPPGRGSFSRELQRAIQRTGQSLAAISRKLAADGVFISPASLSAWQRGHYEPVPDARVHALERVLGLRAGWLALRLAASTPPGPGAADRLPAARNGPADQHRLQAELNQLAAPRLLTDYVIIAIHDDVHVDETGIALTVRQTIRAARSGIDSAWFLYAPEADGATIVMDSDANCRVGRRVRLPDGRHAAELLFDRRLERGEGHTHKFHVLQRPGPADPVYRRRVPYHTVETLRIAVRFARPPRAAWICQWPNPTDPAHQRPTPVDHATASLAHNSPAPATYGIRWSY